MKVAETLTLARAADLVARFPGTPVLVAGDVMLDRFIRGRVTRISPEAPVPVVRFESEDVRLGGAANVAHNLAALGARVTLVGVIGSDSAGARLRAELERVGIGTGSLVEDPVRPTVEKVRIVTERSQQVARIDYEDDADVGSEVERTLVTRVTQAGLTARALLVSDYLKGTITPLLMRTLVGLKTATVPLLVDPKIPHLDTYAGASLITPNQHEAEVATHLRIRSDADARLAAAEFRARARCDAAIITRGEHGMWLSSAETDGGIPAVTREVSDVTGAGDTVVATLALALSNGASLVEAAMLANRAAGIAVAKFGAATVSRDELLDVLNSN
jgi:D-glycero-beta-D-manno-heptose-7-phosphate kinase